MTVVQRVQLGFFGKEKSDYMVEIEIDEDNLVNDLGNRAFHNKSKKSSALRGVIKCVVRPVGAR
jgi:hypothetical protein